MRHTALLLILLSPLAYAAYEIETELQKCASIQSDSRRLECFDRLAGRGSADDAASWQEDRSLGIAISRPANHAVKGDGEQLRPQLVLRCLDRKLAASLLIGTRIQQEHGGDERTVILRFGHEAPFSERMATTADGHSLLFDSPEMAASQLLMHDSLAVQFMPAGAQPVSVSFDTRGLELAIQPLLDACGLRQSADGVLEAAD